MNKFVIPLHSVRRPQNDAWKHIHVRDVMQKDTSSNWQWKTIDETVENKNSFVTTESIAVAVCAHSNKTKE